MPQIHGTLLVPQAQQALRALPVLCAMLLLQALHTQQVTQEVEALLAL